jgi:hypothetical protein
MADSETLPRETGAEKAPQTCPECGAQVPTVESEYGGISGGACPNCYPATDTGQRQEASQSTPPREYGTQVAADADAGNVGGGESG